MTDESKIPPDVERFLRGAIEQGYSFAVALADVIDNSIAAKATSVLVRLEHDGASLTSVLIVDDGEGMNRAKLHEAMRFGTRLTQGESLGKFGLGLKVASLSQAPSFTVTTLARGARRRVGMSWSLDSIARGWFCGSLDAAACRALMQDSIGPLDLRGGGTVVRWENPGRLIEGGEDLEQGLNRCKEEASEHLALRFHRFLESKRVRILVDSRRRPGRDVKTARSLAPVDPFGYRGTGAGKTPYEFDVRFKGASVTVTGHIWPPRVLLGGGGVESGWELSGGATKSQGLYFYRNDRLVQAGGWGSRLGRNLDHPPRSDAASDYTLARVEVHLTELHDEDFRLSVNKNSVDIPEEFASAMVASRTAEGTTWSEYLHEARRLRKRARARRPSRVVPVPSGALTQRHEKRLSKALASKWSPTQTIRIEWGTTGRMRPVALDRSGGRIVLSQAYRKAFLDGRRSSKGDIPLIKALLFLLLRDEFDKTKDSKARERQREELNRVLRALLDERRE